MASLTNIVINDGTADRTFQPIKREGNWIHLLNKIGNTVASYKRLALAFDLHSSSRSTDKVNVDLEFPLERDVAGVYTVTDIARARTTLILPVSMTAAESAAFAALWKNSVANAIVQAYATSRDPML